jgi:hypothetical protein
LSNWRETSNLRDVLYVAKIARAPQEAGSEKRRFLNPIDLTTMLLT